MKFLSASLSLVLPLLTFSRAMILGQDGYGRLNDRQIDSILFRDRNNGYQLVNTIGFHPWMKVATIYAAHNDIGPEDQNKLSFPDIYSALAKIHKRNPEDVDWIITEVAGDIETEGLILGIRDGRGVGLHDEVTVVPGDKEWTDILDTKYYRDAASVNHRAVERVIIRTHTRTLFGDEFDVDSLIFHFPTQENTNSQGAMTSKPADDAENSNAMGWMDFWKEECSKGLKGTISDASNAEELLDVALNIVYNEERLEEAISLGRLEKARADLNLALKGNNNAGVSRT